MPGASAMNLPARIAFPLLGSAFLVLQRYRRSRKVRTRQESDQASQSWAGFAGLSRAKKSRMITAISGPWLFEREPASRWTSASGLNTVRGWESLHHSALILRGCEPFHHSDLILRRAHPLGAPVSKDGRESEPAAMVRDGAHRSQVYAGCACYGASSP